MHTFLSIKRFALALGLVSAVMHLSLAQTHWPQWRGPVSNGIALEGHPPTTWSEQENIRWKKPIPGKGHASPVLWGKRLFLLTAVAEPAADNSGNSGVGNPPEPQAERPGRRPGGQGRRRQRRQRRRRQIWGWPAGFGQTFFSNLVFGQGDGRHPLGKGRHGRDSS